MSLKQTKTLSRTIIRLTQMNQIQQTPITHTHIHTQAHAHGSHQLKYCHGRGLKYRMTYIYCTLFYLFLEAEILALTSSSSTTPSQSQCCQNHIAQTEVEARLTILNPPSLDMILRQHKTGDTGGCIGLNAKYRGFGGKWCDRQIQITAAVGCSGEHRGSDEIGSRSGRRIKSFTPVQSWRSSDHRKERWSRQSHDNRIWVLRDT